MTSPGEWNPSLLDDSLNASELQLKKFPPILIDTTNDFYGMEGNIIVQMNNIDNSSIANE